MPLIDTKEAIGAVSKLLSVQLANPNTSASTVTIGRPGDATANGKMFNLFLYQIDFDGQLKNVSLDAGQRPPLWLVLHYLLTAFDDTKESDSENAHRLLGEGLLAAHELNFLRPPTTSSALVPNPEPLKITFDMADAELISKIMQSSEEKYRVSASLQVRPVMIAPTELPSYAPLIKTVGPPGAEGVVVLPTMGPRLTSMQPEHFEATQEVTLHGDDISREFTEVCVGSICVPMVFETFSRAKFIVPGSLSPGSYPVYIKRILPSGREFSSNALLGHLMPTLNSVSKSAMSDDAGMVTGTLTLDGVRLGGPDDSIFVAFYRNREIVMMLEAEGIAPQNTLSVTTTVPLATYRIILRVNGEQAQNSHEIDWQP